MRRLALIVAATAALAACSKKDPVLEGRAAFEGYGCVNCHKIGDTGGVYGPDLTFIGVRKSPEWLDQWLSNPHAWNKKTMMPAFHLSEPVRSALVAYLSTQKGEAYAKGEAPWDKAELQGDPIAKGEVVFTKAGCVACHGLRGAGGYPNNNVAGGLIPSLTLAADGYSKHEMTELIHKGRNSAAADPGQPAPMIKMPTWGGELEDDEIEAVVEYVFSLKPKNSGSDW